MECRGQTSTLIVSPIKASSIEPSAGETTRNSAPTSSIRAMTVRHRPPSSAHLITTRTISLQSINWRELRMGVESALLSRSSAEPSEHLSIRPAGFEELVGSIPSWRSSS